jgi:hypothetical protein
LEEFWPCPVFANYTLAFELQLRKKHGENLSQGSRRDSKNANYQDTHTLQNPPIQTHTHTHTHKHTHTHITKQFKTTTVQIKTNTVQDIPK